MEEWPILPSVQLESIESIFVDGNYFLLHTLDENTLHESILVLNLESRKKFWIQKAKLNDLVMGKLPVVDYEEEPFDRNNFWPSEIIFENMFLEMYTKVKSIKISFEIKMNHEYFGYIG